MSVYRILKELGLELPPVPPQGEMYPPAVCLAGTFCMCPVVRLL